MKTYTACIYLIITIISFGCINTNSKTIDTTTKDRISAFSPVIDKAIRESLDYVAEIGIDTTSSKTLINLAFVDSEENRCLIVYTQPFYDKKMSEDIRIGKTI